MKRCCRCKTFKPIFEFNKNRSTKDQLSKQCKVCRVEIRSKDYHKRREKILASNRRYCGGPGKEARRKYMRKHYTQNIGYYKQKASARRAKTKRLPPWADLVSIREIYALAERARAAGIDCHVDHIVPLKSDLVCGLHVQNNLAITERTDNARKSNRWWPDMPSGEEWRT